MAFLVSPGVQVLEKDLTNIIPAVATSIGGFAGLFEWGPALEATTVVSEADLIAKFGYPRISSTSAGLNNRLDWYSAANFLSYSNNLQTVRVLPDGARNAASEPVAAVAGKFSIIITGTATAVVPSYTIAYDGTTTVTATPDDSQDLGSIGAALVDALVGVGATNVAIDSEAVSGLVDPTVFYDAGSYTLPANQTINGVTFTFVTNTGLESGVTETTNAVIKNAEDFLTDASSLSNGSVYAKYPGTLGNGLGVLIVDAGVTDSDFANTAVINTTKLSDLFSDKPGTSDWATTRFDNTIEDEVHVVVYTTNSRITGSKFEILETYEFLSKARDSKTADGAPNFYLDHVNNNSKWIYLLNEETAATGGVVSYTAGVRGAIGSSLVGNTALPFAQFATNINVDGVRTYSLGGGTDGGAVTDANYTAGYDVFSDVETIDVNLLITGSQGIREGQSSQVVQKHVIKLAETRKDAMTFVSPSYAAAVTLPTDTKVVEYFNNSSTGFNSTSYAVFDSGWKRQYDRYNDEYFWIPLNPDIAGISARTDLTNDAWFSPAGLNRGFIQNVVKLSFNPNQAQRDALYQKRVNPVITLRGQGTLLYGDKTALSRPSAFDRINVRRLFIVLEKAIATAARYQLFEFNDDLTRLTFVNAVEPFLNDVKVRRGVTDFKVVCDTSNNTQEVIDTNRFVADIYVKPARSINFITLTFTAVRSGVSFSEVTGG